jgi:hypothetical protein
LGRARAGYLGRGRRSGRRADDQIGLGHIQPGIEKAGDDADQPRIARRSATTEDQAALRGESPLRELLVPWREDMVSGGPDGTFAAMQSVLSPPDQEVFTGAVAKHLHESISLALSDGVNGWIDDDLAFIQPWGFRPGQRSRARVLVAGRAGPHGSPRPRALARRCPTDMPGTAAARRRAPHRGP